ncbi:MAG: hypothetical protein GF416_02300 [Candidatus Altiarchaeales archaeon]|nr:hypothetical protein [Candidatus Altiarchaeales archaeon]MBD3415950.1 hypothetical protein [Candidatus Altiarchaeales archaeon]
MEQVNALEVLREAMKLEREGVKFYRRVAKCSRNKSSAEVFRKLADDELQHLEKLELVYDNLAENNEWLVMKDLMETRRESPPEVFDEDFHDDEVDELSAVDMGIKAEEESIEHYKSALRECDLSDEEGCEIFKWLIDFEATHLRILKDLRRELSSS